MARQVSLLNQALKQYWKNTTNYPKYAYFMWRNKLANSNRNFSDFTEQDIIDKYCKGSLIKYGNLKQWENTEECAELMNLLLLEKSNKDFVEIYNAVSEKAKQGDDKAIKTFLTLQNEIRKSVKTKKSKKAEQEEVEEDDDLILE
ncbi:MAG: hypothetical protein GX372_00390 [Ignavibacteria bacterium]|nr:hypothetical protein [Ignavibacteria bacterium]